MSKRDEDDNDNAERYDAGDLLAGMLIGATAAAIGVGAWLLRSPRRERAAPAPPPRRTVPPIEVDERADERADGDDVPRVGPGFN